jgi:hypothetical protein
MKQVCWVIAVVLLLLLLYPALYLVLVYFAEDPSRPDDFVPEYRVGGEVAKSVFAPLHDLDRRMIRPRAWSR